MDPVPYTWRAGSGYIPPYPTSDASAPLPPAAPAAPAAPLLVMHTQYVCFPQPQPIAYAAPIFKAASTASKKSSSSSSKGSTKGAPYESPQLRAGMNYMFPAEHTKLHIFNKSSKVWEDKHTGKSL